MHAIQAIFLKPSPTSMTPTRNHLRSDNIFLVVPLVEIHLPFSQLLGVDYDHVR